MVTSTELDSRQEEFVILLSTVSRIVYRVAYNLTNNKIDAEDLFQDASLAAFRNFDSYEQGTNFKAWFNKILTNCFLMGIRKQARRPQTVELTDLPDSYLYRQVVAEKLYETTTDPVMLVMQNIDAKHIAEAFQDLPEEYRVVSVFYFVEEFSYQEIAEHVGIPIGTVRSRLHRGRRMLQKRLWPLINSHGEEKHD